MDEPQIIRTANGEELVVLSREDYQSLVEALAEAEEELADIAVLDQRKAELAAAQVPDLPPEVSALLLKGHRRFTAVRMWRGLATDALAAKVGISVEMLTGIERGERTVDHGLLTKLASALDVPAAWIEP